MGLPNDILACRYKHVYNSKCLNRIDKHVLQAARWQSYQNNNKNINTLDHRLLISPNSNTILTIYMYMYMHQIIHTCTMKDLRI